MVAVWLRFTQLQIPTLDSVRYEHLLALVYSVNKVRPLCRHTVQDFIENPVMISTVSAFLCVLAFEHCTS